MAGTKDHVVCPLCCHNQILDKAQKGIVDFKRWDPSSSDFIQIRQYSGGRNAGFPKVGALGFHDAVVAGSSDYDQVIDDIKTQTLKLLGMLYNEGVLTSREVRQVVP